MIVTTVLFIIIILILIAVFVYYYLKYSIVINSVSNIITAVNVDTDPGPPVDYINNSKYNLEDVNDLSIEEDDRMLLKLLKIYMFSKFEVELNTLESKGITLLKDIKVNDISFTKIFQDSNTGNILITFRGTTTYEDVIKIDLKNRGKLFNLPSGSYYLHEGFGNILSYISIDILNALNKIGSINEIITFGHSMGGSLSALSGLYLEKYSSKISSYATGFPTFGETTAIEYLQSGGIKRLVTLINRADYIPFIIPLFFKIDLYSSVQASLPRDLKVFYSNIGSINNHNVIIYMDHLIKEVYPEFKKN